MSNELRREKGSILAPSNGSKVIVLVTLIAITIVLFIVSLFVGSSGLSFMDSLKALFGVGDASNVRIVQKVRLPAALAAIIAGGALSLSGLIMQTCLGNKMASPSTLGVSNAAVFGANLSIIVFAGGYLSTGNNVANFDTSSNPYATSLVAFVFALATIFLVMGISKLAGFSQLSIILVGVALSFFWSALTTLIQFYATDVGLSAAVVWSFGDLSRASFKDDLIMLVPLVVSFVFFMIMANRLNALMAGENIASSLGVRVNLLRFICLTLASLICALSVSLLGIIGFVGIICPHVMRKIVGSNHKWLIPTSLLCGSILLLLAHIVSKGIGGGLDLPVGAITSLIGAPFFIVILILDRRSLCLR